MRCDCGSETKHERFDECIKYLAETKVTRPGDAAAAAGTLGGPTTTLHACSLPEPNKLEGDELWHRVIDEVGGAVGHIAYIDRYDPVDAWRRLGELELIMRSIWNCWRFQYADICYGWARSDLERQSAEVATMYDDLPTLFARAALTLVRRLKAAGVKPMESCSRAIK